MWDRYIVHCRAHSNRPWENKAELRDDPRSVLPGPCSIKACNYSITPLTGLTGFIEISQLCDYSVLDVILEG